MKKILFALLAILSLHGDNQTSYVTFPFPETSLPFRLEIKVASFSLPNGLQTYVLGRHKLEFLLLAGRTYGLHGFLGDTFPVSSQNTIVYVLNPSTGAIISRALTDPSSGLTQEQIDQLSVTNAEFFQGDGSDTLYMIGGYGINTATQTRETKSVLTAIDIPNLINWVKNGPNAKSVAKCIRQVSNPLLQVTGGLLYQANSHQPYLLGFGQNFIGSYIDTTSNGIYTHQVVNSKYSTTAKPSWCSPTTNQHPSQIIVGATSTSSPSSQNRAPPSVQSYVALGGVFTPGRQFRRLDHPDRNCPRRLLDHVHHLCPRYEQLFLSHDRPLLEKDRRHVHRPLWRHQLSLFRHEAFTNLAAPSSKMPSSASLMT